MASRNAPETNKDPRVAAKQDARVLSTKPLGEIEMLDTQTMASPTDIPSHKSKQSVIDLVTELKPNIPACVVSHTIDSIVGRRGMQGLVGLIAAAVNPETEYLGAAMFDGPLWDCVAEADDFLSWAARCSDDDWAAHRRRVDGDTSAVHTSVVEGAE